MVEGRRRKKFQQEADKRNNDIAMDFESDSEDDASALEDLV